MLATRSHSPTCLLLILTAATFHFTTAENNAARTGACNYPMVQQHFNLASIGLDGCHRLDSVLRIFGESSVSGSSIERFTATRFAASNLVFVGRALSYVTSEEETVEIEVKCFLKGRLGPNILRHRLIVSGFGQSLENTVCRGIRVDFGRLAVFFATVADGKADSRGGISVWVNENGVEMDVNRTLPALACRENHGLVDDDCQRDGTFPGVTASDWMTAECPVSVSAAMHLLDKLRESPDLRPECRGAPLHREAFSYEGAVQAYAISKAADHSRRLPTCLCYVNTLFLLIISVLYSV